MRTIFAVALLVTLTATTHASAQDPADRGPLTVMEWDAGAVSTAGASIRRRVLYPDTGGPYPIVGVIHGASRTGARHIVLAQTLASWGFVVVLPDMPCTVGACDHAANARQITALLEWVVAQSADGTSRIAGLADPSRRGLIGHSWGALSSHLTAATDPTIDSVVLFDPNDDGTVGRDATSTITAPELQLLAEVPGTCNSQWIEASVTPMLPDPHLQMTVDGSGHCDPEDPGDAFCPFACGVGDASTSTIFRRYAVAWTVCVLAADTRMAAILSPSALSADADVTGIVSSGLAALACNTATPGDDAGTTPDAGTTSVDAGEAVDASSPVVDGGGSADSGSMIPSDSAMADTGAVARDAGAPGGSAAGGCGCSIPTSRPSSAWLGLLALGALLRRALFRRPTRDARA